MRGKSSVKMVSFDLWETLLLETDGADSRRILARCQNLSETLNKFGVQFSVEQLLSALKVMVPWLVKIWETNCDATHPDQIRFIINTASKGSVTLREERIDELSAAYVSPLFEVPPYLNPNAQKVLQWLKDKDRIIGLICNTGRTPGFSLRRFLDKEGIAEYFDLMLFSDEIGIRKPNPEIFLMAAETMNVKPWEVVHVGDNLKSDVYGAKNAGLKAIYVSTETGRDEKAESDPNSLVSISRKLENLEEKEIIPDRIVTSLDMVVEAIETLEKKS